MSLVAPFYVDTVYIECLGILFSKSVDELLVDHEYDLQCTLEKQQ